MIKTKPIKLRAACNQCHTTKVKCSGEKTGCSRCDNLGIECVYSESRVGRVPGMRRRRKPENADARALAEIADPRTMGCPTDARMMGNITDSVLGEIANARPHPRLSPGSSEDLSTGGETIDLDYPFSSTPGSLPPGGEDTGLFGDALLGWSSVLDSGLNDNYGFDERYAADILGTLQDTQQELSHQQQPRQQLSPISQGYPQITPLPRFSNTTNTTNSLNASDNESGYHERSLSPRSRTHHNKQFPLQSPPTITPPQTMVPDNGRNSQCIIVCSQIISSLEKYQADKLKVLDLILGIVKRVTERLDPLVNGQFEFPNTKCISLFGIILYQLVEILEVGCANFLAEAANTPGSISSDILEAGFNEFDFGGLGIGFKDQERFQSQVILEVIRLVFKIIQKVFFISTKAGLDKDNCYHDRDSRLKSLVEKVKKRREGAGGAMITSLNRRSDAVIY